jgi:hypothetical protein
MAVFLWKQCKRFMQRAYFGGVSSRILHLLWLTDFGRRAHAFRALTTSRILRGA